MMSSPTEIFRVSGPSHLTAVDWENSNHRRAVAASLVEGVYKKERDRQENREGPQAKAPEWWEFFHFKLNQVLKDKVDDSIFGAVYEYEYDINSEPKLPKYVVAFRGILTEPDTLFRDLEHSFECVWNTIHGCSRVKDATQTIQSLVSLIGDGKVWLAGHSLGSAIGLLAGKNMANMGFPLETYLFNPPFPSVSIEWIEKKWVRNGILIAGRVVKAVRHAVVKAGHHHHHDSMNGADHRQHDSEEDDHDSLSKLSAWFPNLFVNQSDRICSGYIRYFEERKKVEENGAGRIARLATKCSGKSILSCALGKNSEPYHLLPSASLTVNLTPSPEFRRAHGVEQWWNPNFHSRTTRYKSVNKP